MLQSHIVHGYDNFVEFIKQFENKHELVYVYFSGSKLPTGESWCPTCIRVWPAVEKALESLSNAHFIHVEVGDRSTWKDQKNPFRFHPRCQLKVIPALLKWKSPQRLDGDQCGNPDLLDMIFNDDD